MIDASYGIMRDYGDLRAILSRVRDIRNISCEEIDRLAGWPSGLAGKVLCAEPIRRLGPNTIAGGLGALGVMLIAVDDPEALAKYTARAEKRDERQVRVLAKPSMLKPTWLFSRRQARKLRAEQAAAQSDEQRSRIARKAARARWIGHRKRKRAQKAVSTPGQDTKQVQPSRQ